MAALGRSSFFNEVFKKVVTSFEVTQLSPSLCSVWQDANHFLFKALKLTPPFVWHVDVTGIIATFSLDFQQEFDPRFTQTIQVPQVSKYLFYLASFNIGPNHTQEAGVQNIYI